MNFTALRLVSGASDMSQRAAAEQRADRPATAAQRWLERSVTQGTTLAENRARPEETWDINVRIGHDIKGNYMGL